MGPYHVTDRVSAQCLLPRSPSTFQYRSPAGNGLNHKKITQKPLPFTFALLLFSSQHLSICARHLPSLESKAPSCLLPLESFISAPRLAPSPISGASSNPETLDGPPAPVSWVPAAHTQVCLLSLLFLRLYVELRCGLDFLHPGSPWTGRDRMLPNRMHRTGSGSAQILFPGLF